MTKAPTPSFLFLLLKNEDVRVIYNLEGEIPFWTSTISKFSSPPAMEVISREDKSKSEELGFEAPSLTTLNYDPTSDDVDPREREGDRERERERETERETESERESPFKTLYPLKNKSCFP